MNLINTQGLTQAKTIEIEKILAQDEMSLCFLVETHLTRNSLKFDNNIKFLSQMRKLDDKKGGGLMIIWNNTRFTLEKIDTKHPDLLASSCLIGNLSFTIILVYISTNDNKRNDIIYGELNLLIEKYQHSKLVILGDFNGHIGIIGPQPINKNCRRFNKYCR